MEHFWSTFLGASLAFLLGVLALLVKEIMDLRKRVMLFSVAAIYLAQTLRDYLHEDPRRCASFDLKAVSSYLDAAMFAKDLRDIYAKLFTIYMDWSREFYCAGGIKVGELVQTKAKLDILIQRLQSRPSFSLYFGFNADLGG